MVRQACFLIAQGCQDDLQRSCDKFVRLMHEHDVVGKLKAVLGSPHDDLKTIDIRELITFTIDRYEYARTL